MLYHAESGQYFSNQRQAQSRLKTLSPPLELVTVNDPGPPAYNEATQRLIRDQTLTGAVRTVSYTVEDLTQAEIDAKVEEELNLTEGVNDPDRAIKRLIDELWLYVSTGKRPDQATAQEIQTARRQVRNRLETHLRNLKGLQG